MTSPSVLALLMAGVLSLQQPASEAGQRFSSGRISGRIIAADSGRPIEGAGVQLVSFDAMRPPQTAATGADGRFEFIGIEPGRYHLTASAARHVTLDFGQTLPTDPPRPIDLRPAEHFASADVALPRPASISGVVLDEFGDPAPSVTVRVSRREFVAGRNRLMPIVVAGRTTDDKGRFRVSDLPPGEYFVMAMTGVFTERNESGGFAITLHPGSADAASAEPVRIAPGDDREVALTMQPAPSAHVSGRVVDRDGRPQPHAGVVLFPSDRSGTSVLVDARGGSDAAGEFVFRNVPRGQYTIQAFGRPERGGGPGRAPFAWLPVVVDGTDLTDRVLTVTAGTTMRGRITFEGAERKPIQPRIQVLPQPVEFDSSPIAGGPPPSEMRADWTFEVRNLNGWRIVRVAGASPAWALKQVLWKGVDVTDKPMDMRESDIDGVEIILSTAANATVGGTVIDADGKAATDFAVILFASDSNRWHYPSRFLALGRPNQNGRFEIRGLPPESYLAVALTRVRGGEWRDPAFLEALRPLATLVPLGAGDSRALELRIAR